MEVFRTADCKEIIFCMYRPFIMQVTLHPLFLTYRQNDGLLAVGTHGNGIYQTNISSVGDVLALDDKQNNLNKITIYPNPTTDKLTLSFITQKSTNTTWTLYTEIGKKIKTGKQKLIVGINQINLDLEKLKSGIYFVSLEIDGKIVTKQIVKQ